MTLFIYLIILFSCASCIALTEIWKLGGMIRYRRWLLSFEVTVMFCLAWNNWWSPLQIKLSTILAVKWIFVFRIAVQSIVISIHQQGCCNEAVILSSLTHGVTDVLQTAGTGGNLLCGYDRQRVAGRDWVTTWTYIFASQLVFQFDCPSIVHVSSSTFHDFRSVVEPVTLLQSGWWRVERNCKKVQ